MAYGIIIGALATSALHFIAADCISIAEAGPRDVYLTTHAEQIYIDLKKNLVCWDKCEFSFPIAKIKLPVIRTQDLTNGDRHIEDLDISNAMLDSVSKGADGSLVYSWIGRCVLRTPADITMGPLLK